MTRQMIVVVVLLLGLSAIHTAGTHRPLAPRETPDAFAWLGPLPARMGPQDLSERWQRLADQAANEVRAVDVRRFVCRSPAEVGTLPMMKQVVHFTDNLPGSWYDDAEVAALLLAAQRGNWIARTLILLPLSEKRGTEDSYRAVQLAQWLHQHRLGQLYAQLAEAAGGVGYYYQTPDDTSPEILAAAMHHDYVAQTRAGTMLIEQDDPELVAVGGKMLACAASARASYRKMAQAHDGMQAIARQAPGRQGG